MVGAAAAVLVVAGSLTAVQQVARRTPLAGATGMPTAVNRSGVVVGVAKGAPVRWRPDGSASALPLPSAGNNEGYVNGLSGHFAFGIVYGKGVMEIVRWDLTTGTVTSLGSDTSGDGATIVGFTAGTTHRPVVWHC